MREEKRQCPQAQQFRKILANVPTAVAVVTADGAAAPAGFVIGSFVSVSLDPLLVGFFPARTSSSWPRVRDTGRFCINILADHQRSLSQKFAVSGGDKFADVEWRPGPTGSPRLEGCVAWIECELESETPAGDHSLVLGRVISLERGADAHALVFHRGDYTSTRSTLAGADRNVRED